MVFIGETDPCAGDPTAILSRSQWGVIGTVRLQLPGVSWHTKQGFHGS